MKRAEKKRDAKALSKTEAPNNSELEECSHSDEEEEEDDYLQDKQKIVKNVDLYLQLPDQEEGEIVRDYPANFYVISGHNNNLDFTIQPSQVIPEPGQVTTQRSLNMSILDRQAVNHNADEKFVTTRIEPD